MMKKKLLAILTAVLMLFSFSALGACSTPNGGEPIDYPIETPEEKEPLDKIVDPAELEELEEEEKPSDLERLPI